MEKCNFCTVGCGNSHCPYNSKPNSKMKNKVRITASGISVEKFNPTLIKQELRKMCANNQKR